MADIRINALATTAASTASDDFVAVDGSANGTRKLNAYSPTFGGNLAVSGAATVTGTIRFDGQLLCGNAGGIQIRSAAGDANLVDVSGGRNLTMSGAATFGGNLTVAGGTARFQDPTNSYGVTITTAAAKTLVETLFGGSSLGIRVGGSGSDSLTIASTGATIRDNLTVSGTGDSRFAGKLAVGTSPLADRMFYVSGNTGTSGASQFSAVINPTLPNTVTTSAYGLYLATNIASGATVTNAYSLYVAAPTYAGSTVTNKWGLYIEDTNKNYVSGNFLVGTTTDSGNGKLQLATHTTSAGGIGFGSDNYLFRSFDGRLQLGTSYSNIFFELAFGGAKKAQIWSTGSVTSFGSTVAGASVQIQSGAEATALTLDSSQRCILAGALRLNNAYVAGAPTATGYVTLQDSAGNTYKVLVGT